MNARHAAPDDTPEPPASPQQRQSEAAPTRGQADTALRRRRFYRIWLLVVAGIDIGTGLAYVTGPVNAPNLQLIASTGAPLFVWALLFAICGGLLAARWYYIGGFAGAVLWLLWTFALAVTVLAGTAASASGLPIFGGIAALHLLVVYGAHTRLIAHAGRKSH